MVKMCLDVSSDVVKDLKFEARTKKRTTTSKLDFPREQLVATRAAPRAVWGTVGRTPGAPAL